MIDEASTKLVLLLTGAGAAEVECGKKGLRPSLGVAGIMKIDCGISLLAAGVPDGVGPPPWAMAAGKNIKRPMAALAQAHSLVLGTLMDWQAENNLSRPFAFSGKTLVDFISFCQDAPGFTSAAISIRKESFSLSPPPRPPTGSKLKLTTRK